MPNPLENLSGPGKPLKAKAPDDQEFAGLLRSDLGEYEGLLDLDERLVTDLITATQAVADTLQARLP